MTEPRFFQATEMPDAGWWEALWSDPVSVLTSVGIRPGMTVVDLCPGDGWFTLQIAKIAGRVTAIDIDDKLLEQSHIRLGEHGIANCDFVTGDANDIATLVQAKWISYFSPMPFTACRSKHGCRPRCGPSLRMKADLPS